MLSITRASIAGVKKITNISPFENVSSRKYWQDGGEQ
jgi:hypothetical protein